MTSLKANRLLSPGDTVALVTPIFSPYLEIPLLAEYDLKVVDVRMDAASDWQLPDSELDKLRDPAVKLLCLVNPSNPPSTKLSGDTLARLAALVADDRPDLMIITDDVYGTFADDFVSVFAACPRNTVCVYSFSKYFGATGWRLGTIALHHDNVLDDALAALPETSKHQLDERYATLAAQPRRLPFLDRLVADSRAVALNHTAGLSAPQQLQTALFALHGLMDRQSQYKDAGKSLIRGRYQTLYRSMGITVDRQPDDVGYYSLIDLQELAGALYGPEFEQWFLAQDLGSRFLFRLAEETGVVLLPGRGFEVVDVSARVSLANLTDHEYAAIGRATRRVLSEYHDDYLLAPPAGEQPPEPTLRPRSTAAPRHS